MESMPSSRTTREAVASSLANSLFRVRVNFVEPTELTIVPGINSKFATKIVNLRSVAGSLTSHMLVACFGAKVDKLMLGFLNFEVNPELTGELPEMEEASEAPVATRGEKFKLKDRMTNMLREFVTPVNSQEV